MSVWAVPLASFFSVFCPFLLRDVIVCPPASDTTSVPSPLLSLLTLVSPSHGSKCLLLEKVWGVWAECRAITHSQSLHLSLFLLWIDFQTDQASASDTFKKSRNWGEKAKEWSFYGLFCTYRGDMGLVETVSEWLQRSSTGFSLEQCWWLQEKIFKRNHQHDWTQQLSDLVTSGLSLLSWPLSVC